MYRNKRILYTAIAAGLVLGTSSPSWAGGGRFEQNHPRRAQVLGRDNNMNNTLNQDYGHLGGNYGRLENRDQKIQRQEQREAQNNGGYLTSGQQARLNTEENGLNRQINRDQAWGGGGMNNGFGGRGFNNGGFNGAGFNGGGFNGGGSNGGGFNGGGNQFAQNHPRRAQVLGQDNSLNQQINQDRGNLGGNYGQLEARDQSIRNQEQRDARMNGGYLTSGQQQQLDREENGLSKQINRDNTLGSGGFNGGGNQFAQNHPRRSQVLSQDHGLNQQLNQDKGNLGGNYGQLESRDQSIRNQEQHDARMNGGYITPQQQQQLDQRETNLQNSINKDLK